MLKKIIRKLTLYNNIDISSSKRFEIDKDNFNKKKILRDVYVEFYKKFLEYEIFFCKDLKSYINLIRLEIGSGGSFFKDIDKNIITSDVVESSIHDIRIDACNLPFPDNSIKSIFSIFAFHHFKEPFKFLDQLNTKLANGGCCFLIEPYYGLFSCICHRITHDDEYFDKNEPINRVVINKDSMKLANQGLSYIFFIKHKNLIEKKYPNLIIKKKYIFNNYLRFLFSGGVGFKQLANNRYLRLLKFIEFLFFPLKYIFGLHYILVIKKKN